MAYYIILGAIVAVVIAPLLIAQLPLPKEKPPAAKHH